VYNIVAQAYPRQLSNDHIAEFAFEENKRRGWVNKQDSMYSIKNECTRQGLRNGSDYVFLNPAATNGNYDTIQVYFEDISYVTYMTMWWDSKEEK
jgi:hypothetical protein